MIQERSLVIDRSAPTWEEMNKFDTSSLLKHGLPFEARID